MSNKIIKKLLNGHYHSEKPILTKSIIIERTLVDREIKLISDLNIGKSFGVVCDPVTYTILGKSIIASLKKKYNINQIILKEEPLPNIETVNYVKEKTKKNDALIAIGSGTINDICKYASFTENKPYAVFGTAPSMNGYSSANAAITVHGHKKSLAAHIPTGIFLDLEILCNAPERMIQSGFGDSCARSTSQADWLLAHLLFGIPYNQDPFDILVNEERKLFKNAKSLLDKNIESMCCLANTLILSGFGMTICGGSMPASQSEHLISHYIEMLEPEGTPYSFHGEHIAVTTLTVAKIQEMILKEKLPRVKPCRLTEKEFIQHYGEELGKSCWPEFREKMITEVKAGEINRRLEKNWEEIKDKIQSIIIPADIIKQSLLQTGTPTSYTQLGVTEEFYKEAVIHCREIRDRYTFLDFAFDCSLFNENVCL